MSNDKSYFDDFTDQIQGGDGNKIRLLKIIYASSVPYYLCLWSIKFAIIGLYFKIVPNDLKYTRLFLQLTFMFIIVSGLAIVLLNVFLCEPISQNWNLDRSQACYSSTSPLPFVISVVSNFITDILIFIIPFPVIRSLKTLNSRQKYSLIFTFSLGVITIIVATTRAVLLALAGSISEAAVLSALECCTAILVACLPALRVLLKIRPFQRRSLRKSNNNQNQNQNNNDDDEDVTISTSNVNSYDIESATSECEYVLNDGGYMDKNEYEKRKQAPLPPLPLSIDSDMKSLPFHDDYGSLPSPPDCYVVDIPPENAYVLSDLPPIPTNNNNNNDHHSDEFIFNDDYNDSTRHQYTQNTAASSNYETAHSFHTNHNSYHSNYYYYNNGNSFHQNNSENPFSI